MSDSNAAANTSSSPSSSPSRQELSGPDRSGDRCYQLGQASLRCQMDAQIKYNHNSQTPAVLAACKQKIDDYLVCYRREQEKRRT